MRGHGPRGDRAGAAGGRWRGRAASALLGVAALAAGSLAAIGPAAANAPGNPGTPSAPVTVFTEDFENGQGAAVTTLTDYTGAAPTAEQYTADPAWLTACNGLIVSAQGPAAPPPGVYCGSYWAANKQMAAALGSWAGGDATTNHSLTAYTSADPGAGRTELETVRPVPLSAENRFLTFSVDAAAQNCFASHPLLAFYLLDGATPRAAFSSPIDPCQDPGRVIGGTSVGTYTSNGSVLFSGDSAGIRLVNEQASGGGNDGAIDNIRLLDATPQLDQAFSPAQLPVGAPATLTFTVTNTAELAAKQGWSFTGRLPAGLVLDPGSATTDCGSGTAVADPGPGTVTVHGDLAAGQPSCTATVRLTSLTGGTYRVCTADVTARIGLDPPGCTSVTFTAPVFDARAHGVRLTTPLGGIGPLPASAHSCTPLPGEDDHAVLDAGLGAVGTLGVLTTDASGTVDTDGTRTASAHAQVTGINLLGGLITADLVGTSARARQPLTADGPGAVDTGGATTLVNLRVAGVAVSADAAPNTTIALPLVGSLVVNQRTPLAGGKGVRVTALSLTLLTGTRLTIAQSSAALLTTADACPAS
ncbi:choice-of-anchor P family protein [Kitasatospora sp. NA04385]|uniref:choice-of-anchor P family protein n=1 Tax=Kitasatospora sp. NA04385 TaxID=2742135 RepID=UPI001C379957|nr:choice-of-anchor P family protein [Kitasatospora sp. NA04385]